jgi:GH15 family glucan-1,4-alpha-glucosidase
VQVYGGDRMDASLLMLSRYGYLPGSDERMKATRRRIAEQLQVDGLVYRYGRDSDDGLPGHEGAFGICSFWMIEALALEGEVDTAARTFEDVCGRSNELGLFSEEIDPQSGELLGNFPQAFTHVGLINAALTVSEQLGERPVREDKPDETREAV